MSFWRRCCALVSFAGLILVSCGIEDYLYLQPIDSGNILLELNSRATVNLPFIDTTNYYYFQNFVIYYRIYISDQNVTSEISSGDLQRINGGLYSDYWALNPYTTLDNNRSPSAMGSVFSGRKYFSLAIEGASIDSILDTGSLPPQGSLTALVLDFAQIPGTIPSLKIQGAEYNLYRHNDPATNSPRPDRYFINSSGLQSSSNISSTALTNMDVQDKETTISGQRYTYVAMYILLYGMDNMLLPIYSAPTFIGIFRLPDE
jgi:hypothetical protein